MKPISPTLHGAAVLEPPPGMMALAPGRFGPLPDDELVSRGLWQYAHYYDPDSAALEATAPAGAQRRPAEQAGR